MTKTCINLALVAAIATAILVVPVSGQTTNNDYEVTVFGGPPSGEAAWGDTISVAADGNGSILVLRRAEPPVVVFNRDGEIRNSWGAGLFPDKHSIDVDFEGFVWVTDRTDHMVYKFTMDGRQLLSLGTKGVMGDNASTEAFNRPSDVAVAPNGDIFVASRRRCEDIDFRLAPQSPRQDPSALVPIRVVQVTSSEYRCSPDPGFSC